MLLGDLVTTSCDNNVNPPVCTDDPERSWMTSLQFYTGLGLVQVGEAGEGRVLTQKKSGHLGRAVQDCSRCSC